MWQRGPGAQSRVHFADFIALIDNLAVALMRATLATLCFILPACTVEAWHHGVAAKPLVATPLRHPQPVALLSPRVAAWAGTGAIAAVAATGFAAQGRVWGAAASAAFVAKAVQASVGGNKKTIATSRRLAAAVAVASEKAQEEDAAAAKEEAAKAKAKAKQKEEGATAAAAAAEK